MTAHRVKCAYCGAATSTGLYARQGNVDAICCERCRLAQLCMCCEPNTSADLYAAFAEALAATLDLREVETGQHSKRVACHTQLLAKRFISDPARLRQIYWGSLLHDIGKIGIADVILLKQGALDDAEWVIMKTHAEMGYRIVAAIPGMQEAADLVWSHEERFDGNGYPRGLAGNAIPFSARLFSVIDTLDAMTSDRPYRKGLSFEDAKAEICRVAGTQFDPVAVDAFVAEEAALREMVQMKCTLPHSAFP